MTRFIRVTKERPGARQLGSAGIVSRAELAECSYRESAFFDKRKDHRCYELVDTGSPSKCFLDHGFSRALA
jgi:hypothetical protein